MDIFDRMENDGARICRGLAELPAFTHLCLNDVEVDVLGGLEQCARLQLLASAWDRASEIPDGIPVTDPRFVVTAVGDYWSDWEVGARGGTDFWAAADVFVSRKCRGEIEGKLSCYPPNTL
jgi:hypothetical protein